MDFLSKKIILIFLIVLSAIIAVLINPIYLLAGLTLFFSILFFYFHPNWGIYLMVLFFPFVGLQFFFGQDYNLPLIDIIASLVFIAWILRCGSNYISKINICHSREGRNPLFRKNGSQNRIEYLKNNGIATSPCWTSHNDGKNATLYNLILKKIKYSLTIFPGWPIFALFIAVNLISLFTSYDLFLSLKYILRPLVFFYFAFLVLPCNTINSYKILKNVLWIFLSLGIFVAAIGTFSLFLDFGELIPRAKPIAIAGWAPLGFNHNALAELLITIIPLNWLLIILSKKEIVKKFLLTALILMIFILLLTFSRTGWICLFLEILLFWYFIYREQTKKLFKKIPSLTFLILPIAFIFFLLMFQLLTSSVGWQANENRLFLNEITWEAFLNHPIIGNGAGTFVSLVRANPAYILEYGQPLDSHGVIQKIAVESGILGLIAFLAFIFYILRKLFLAFKNVFATGEDTDPRLQLNKNILFAFFIVAIASFVFQLFSTSYFIANFWLPIGIALAAVKIIQNQKISAYSGSAEGGKNQPARNAFGIANAGGNNKITNKFYYLIKNMNSEKNKKIKLTYIICSLGYGGAERFLIDLIKNTNREKYEISVLCVIEGGPLIKELKLMGINSFIIGKKTKLGISTIWKIYKYLKKEKIQIVHTHLFAGDTWGRIAAILARTPLIISTEHSVNFNEGIIKRLIKKFLSYFTDKIIAISKTVKENSQKRDWINSKKIEAIYNGINLDKFLKLDSRFHGNDKEKNGNDITLGFVARLEKEKGAKYLIEALHFCHSRPASKCERNLKLKILGDGTQRKNLETMSSQLGLKDKIKFLGFKNNPTEFYQEIDILIIPSLWEGLSIVALEAMASDIPIIASNAGGLKEIIEDRKTGLLFEPENSKNLAEKILWAIENSDKMNMMAQNAKIKVKDFDIKKKAKEYERIYENFTN